MYFFKPEKQESEVRVLLDKLHNTVQPLTLRSLAWPGKVRDKIEKRNLAFMNLVAN